MWERTVTISGFSKSYASDRMEIRLYRCSRGFGLFLKVHQHKDMCGKYVSICAVEALKNGDDDVKKMKMEYDKRRRFLSRA